MDHFPALAIKNRVRAVYAAVVFLSCMAVFAFALTAHAALSTVVTQPATDIAQTSATLHGHFEETNGVPVAAWFEYGVANNLSFSTDQQTVNPPQSASADIAFTLTGLAPNTTYSYRIVAKDSDTPVPGIVLTFTTAGGQTGPTVPTVLTNAATGVTQNSASLSASISPSGSGTSAWFEWGTNVVLGNTTSVQQLGSGTASVSLMAGLSGLSPNTTYYFRAVAQNSAGITNGAILSFTTSVNPPPSAAPAVTTAVATNVSQTSLTLNGSATPNGAATNAWFEWGSSYALGNTTGSQSIGSGSSPQSFSATLSGLSPNTTYYFRAVAQNSAGAASGSIFSATTQFGSSQAAPTVWTNAATSVYQSTAALNGQVNPNSNFTTAWFEWGASSSFGNTTASQSMGSGNASVGFSATLTNLSSNTNYFYRAVAQSSAGNAYGITYGLTTSSGSYGGGYTGGGSGTAPSAHAPVVSTMYAKVQNDTSATLKGSVSYSSTMQTLWFEWGTSPGLGNSTPSQPYVSGPLVTYSYLLSNLTPNTTYYYRAAAQNSAGTGFGSVVSFSTGGASGSAQPPYQPSYNPSPPYPPPSYYSGAGSAPTIATAAAYPVYQTYAYLRGTVLPNGYPGRAWFEWGPSVTLGQTTPSVTLTALNANNDISHLLTGLIPNRTYYYRAAAQTNGGVAYGGILSFTTSVGSAVPSPTPAPPPAPAPSPAPSPSSSGEPTARPPAQLLLSLAPSADTLDPAPGEEFTYTLAYRNVSETDTISELSLVVNFPSALTYRTSSFSPTAQSETSRTFTFEALAPGASGAMTIGFTVDTDAREDETAVIGAIADYRDSAGRAGTLSSYLSLTIGSARGFFAALFSVFGVPFGWALLIAVLLIFAYGAYRMFRRTSEPMGVHETPLEADNLFRKPPPPVGGADH